MNIDKTGEVLQQVEPAQDLPIRSPVKQKYHHYSKLWWLLRAPFVWTWRARKCSLKGEHQVLNHGFWGVLYPIFRPNDHPTSTPNSRLFPYFHKFVTWSFHYIYIYIEIRSVYRFPHMWYTVCSRHVRSTKNSGAPQCSVTWSSDTKEAIPTSASDGGMKSFDAKTYGFLKILRECWGRQIRKQQFAKHHFCCWVCPKLIAKSAADHILHEHGLAIKKKCLSKLGTPNP